MDLNDINYSDRHYLMLKENLIKSYDIDMTFFESLPVETTRVLEKAARAIKTKMVVETLLADLDSRSPIPLLTEALRVYLKEVYPQRKVKFSETIEYTIDPNTGAAIAGDGTERPDLYWRQDQYKLEKALTQRLQNPNSTPMDFIKMDPRDDNPTDAPSNTNNIYVSVLNPNKINGVGADVLDIQISKPESPQASQTPVVPNEDKKGFDMTKIDKLAKITESTLLQEAELQRAEIVLATKDIVSRLQKQIEDIAGMATDDVLPLVDGMKENFGSPTANSFAHKAEEALQKASDSVQDLKDLFDSYARALEKHISDGSVPNDMSMDTDIQVDEPVEEPMPVEEPAAEPDEYEKKSPEDALMGESIVINGKVVKLNESQQAAVKFAREYNKSPMPTFLLSEQEKKHLKVAARLMKGN